MLKESVVVSACGLVLFLLVVVGTARADELEVRGRVIDEAGRPLADVDVDSYWRANGSGRDKDGVFLDLKKEENVKLFWSHVGEMEPSRPGFRRVEPGLGRTGPDGRFSLKIPDICHALMALDRSRRRGGLARIPKGNETSSVEIRIGPLVKVRGRFEGPEPGKRPDWTHVYTLLPEDPTCPLDTFRLVGCGSFEARFEMSLPPGRYLLNGYTDPRNAQLVPDKEVVLTNETPEVDLGILHLSPYKSPLETNIERSKADGSWGDYTKSYGRKPPRWHLVDTHGVPRDVQLSDYKGKWVLLEFWGFDCRYCLRTGLPKLVKFYEEHQAQRDRFEILTICIDYEGNLKTMADVDRTLEPIVKHAWGGKSLPFPVMLDNTFKTWESYGLKGLGELLLIDPEGNLVQGDETVLAEKLKDRENRPRSPMAASPVFRISSRTSN
jgi:hypothetical protein